MLHLISDLCFAILWFDLETHATIDFSVEIRKLCQSYIYLQTTSPFAPNSCCLFLFLFLFIFVCSFLCLQPFGLCLWLKPTAAEGKLWARSVGHLNLNKAGLYLINVLHTSKELHTLINSSPSTSMKMLEGTSLHVGWTARTQQNSKNGEL